jgi:hypothetical protein
MFRSAIDLLIDQHHIYNEFSYRELQLKLRILRDQSKYTIFTKLNKRKDRLQNAASTVLKYGTQSESEIERKLSIQSEVEREYDSDSEPKLTPQDLEQDAIINGNLLPDWKDPEYNDFGVRVYSQSVRKAYDLPERLKYNDHAPESRLKMEVPDVYTDSDLNLIPYASHITYASDLVTDQNNVSEYLSDDEDWDFIDSMHHSEYYLLWDHSVPGSD